MLLEVRHSRLPNGTLDIWHFRFRILKVEIESNLARLVIRKTMKVDSPAFTN